MTPRTATLQSVADNVSNTLDYDTDVTLAASDDDGSDATSNTRVIELLSDTSSEFGDKSKERICSPAPTSASVEVFDIDEAGTALPTHQEARSRYRGGPMVASQRTRMTEAQQMQIVSLREAGWTVKRIAGHLDCNVHTVNSFIQRRRTRIERLVSGLPGSAPCAPRAAAAPNRQQGPKSEDANTTVGQTRGRGTPAKRECSAAPNIGTEFNNKVDVKPKKQAKEERPF